MNIIRALETAPPMPEWSDIAGMIDTAVRLICVGAIIVAAIVWLYKTAKTLREPGQKLESRVAACEEHLDNDNRRFKEQEEVNRLMLRSVVAMQSHMLDGNHTEDLQRCAKDINEYLLTR